MLRLNPLGDVLALLAALTWAFYSILTRKIGDYGYNTLQVTRRIFCWGLLFMLPTLPLSGFRWGLERLAQPEMLANLLFLGLGASALCFATWNFTIRILGAIKTSVYIYAVPVVSVITATLLLGERLTGLALTGMASSSSVWSSPKAACPCAAKKPDRSRAAPRDTPLPRNSAKAPRRHDDSTGLFSNGPAGRYPPSSRSDAATSRNRSPRWPQRAGSVPRP